MITQILLATQSIANIKFLSAGQDAANASTYNWNAVFTPKVGDLIVVGVSGRSAGTTSVTQVNIGGKPATIHAISGSSLQPSVIASRIIEGGDTGDIQAVFSGNQGRAGYCAVAVGNFKSDTPIDTDAVGLSGSATTRTSTIDVVAGGVAFFFQSRNSVGVTNWTGADKVSDEVSESSDTFSGAIHTAKQNELGYQVITSWTGSSASPLLSVSFR